jgi:SAM-dependent methyltransferase
MTANYDPQTVAGFGEEWTAFDYSPVRQEEIEQSFDLYFSIFPWDCLPAQAVGYDLGCGSGRWAKLVAPQVGTLYCIDASPAALAVARKKLATLSNVEFFQASVEAIPLNPESMDFGYSLGVLHHIPDTLSGMKACVEKLKPGAPFLLYLYYAFDNRPGWFRLLWKISNFVRVFISKLPFKLKYITSQIIASVIYYPLARTAWVAEKLMAGVDRFPLSFYRNLSFYAMRTDALDRFGTRLESRFEKRQIQQMMQDAGLEKIHFSDRAPYWCAIGYKKSSSL